MFVHTLYGACRAATYDNQIRRWIREDVVQTELTAEDANMNEFGRRLLKKCALSHLELRHLSVTEHVGPTVYLLRRAMPSNSCSVSDNDF